MIRWIRTGQAWLFLAMFIIAAAVIILSVAPAPPPCGEYPCEITGDLR